MTRGTKTTIGVAGTAGLAALLFASLYLAGGLRRLDLVAYDYFFRMRGVRKGDERIVFVDIDDATVRRFGAFPQPKYRKACADLIRLLSRPQSRAHGIGFDIFFTETSSTSWPKGAGDVDVGENSLSVDEFLGLRAKQHGNVYFPGIFLKPFHSRSDLQTAVRKDKDLAGTAASILQAEPEFCVRYLGNPWEQREALAGKLKVPAERITPTLVRLLDEEFVDQTRSLVLTELNAEEITPFVLGRLDERMKKVLKPRWRLEWTKEYFYAENTAATLWEKVYEPALQAHPQTTFMGALGARGFSYDRLVSPKRFRTAAKRRDAVLRARLATKCGTASDRFGTEVLACYAGRTPELFPVIPVLEACGELVTVQPYLTDGDGKVRSFPLVLVQGKRAYPAMGLAAALDLLGVAFDDCRIEDGMFTGTGSKNDKGFRVPVDALGRVLLDWRGPWMSSYRHVSMASLLVGENADPDQKNEAQRLAESLRGKIVFVGLTATGTHDLNPTPFQERYPMVGVNAHVADGVLRGHFPREAPTVPVLLLVVLGALLGAVAGGALGRGLGPLLAAPAAGAAFFGSFWAFAGAGIFSPPVPLMGSLGLAYVSGLFWRYLVTEREGRKVRQVFAFRTSPELVDEMMRNPQVVRLGGKRVQATVFFADLAGFTTVAEATEPEDLIHLLNEYLTEISTAIIECGGYLDKYEGDAVMAILGAPVERRDHAAAACNAALETQSRLDALRARLAADGRAIFRCRVGLASGDIVVGNIGSEARADYTALGDNVNLASRLEGANKVYGTRILVSEETEELAGPGFCFREVDLLRVKGRRGASRVLELFGRAGAPSEEQRAGLECYARGLELYRAKDFSAAQDRFIEANEKLGGEDGPSETFVGRCQRFILKPPPEGWDGVYEMTGK